MRRVGAIVAAGLVAVVAVAVVGHAAPTRPTYFQDVKPILDRACLRCHATPEVVVTMNRARNRGGLSLSTRTEALKGGSNIGVVIVPGKSAESPLVHLVAGYPHEKTQVRAMPPGEKERLSRAEVGVLRAWIDQGAAWPE